MEHKTLVPFFFLFLFPSFLWADMEPAPGDVLTAYVVADIRGAGDVKILKGGEDRWADAREGSVLEEGDRIRLGAMTESVLSLRDGTLLHLGEKSELALAQLTEDPSSGFQSRLNLLKGSILSDVKGTPSEKDPSFKVGAGDLVFETRTGIFEVSKEGEKATTAVQEGRVEVGSGKGTQQVLAGNTGASGKGRNLSTGPNSSWMTQRFNAWKDMKVHVEAGLAQQGTLSSSPAGDIRSQHLLGPSPSLSAGKPGANKGVRPSPDGVFTGSPSVAGGGGSPGGGGGHGGGGCGY